MSPDPISRRTSPQPYGAPDPAAAGRAFYLAQAEACLSAAVNTNDASARQMHEDECKLWLMLARQRQAIEAVMQCYLETPGAA